MSIETKQLIEKTEEELQPVFKRMEEVELVCQARVLDAFRSNRVAARHFNPTTGYGYDDEGRDVLDRIFAEVMQAEAALVVPQLSSGTHTLFTVISALLRPGDNILSPVGKPYDTLLEAIGIEGSAAGSLHEFGIGYDQIELTENGEIDLGLTAALCRKLFKYRKVHAWPPTVLKGEMWEQTYADQKRDLDVLPTVDEAIAWANDLIAKLDMV